MKCVLILLVSAGLFVVSPAEEETCVNGSTKNVECNTCYCSNDVWACTKKGCGVSVNVRAKRSQQPACRPGETRLDDDGCNHCVCANGHWACTLMLCPKGAHH